MKIFSYISIGAGILLVIIGIIQFFRLKDFGTIYAFVLGGFALFGLGFYIITLLRKY